MTSIETDAVLARAEAQFDETVARLTDYLRHAAISSDAAHHPEVERLADRIAADLAALGFDNARVLRLPGALPTVAAERIKQPGKPTVLIYGHLDLQPVKGEPWSTPPHEATTKGDRLYARGASDDMGGWVSHLAAMKAWLETVGELPLNVKLIIEGEEEIGSPNLERYMDAFPEAFSSDVMILTDCENPSTEIPGLTVSLRGLCEVELVCEAIESDVHSGLWGNIVPDVSTALVKLLSKLVDDDGRFAHGRMEVPEAWRQDAAKVPLTDDVIRVAAHLIEGVNPIEGRGRPHAEWVWRQPAITILTTTLPTPDRQKNALRAKASATLSIRIAPGQNAEQIKGLLNNVLFSEPAPGGVKVTLVDKPGGAQSWLYTPKGPAFAAADRAYEKVWGRKLLQIGVGGSIPFVALFGRRFGDLPLILNGVMDPQSGAHGPNESLHLGVFRKCILTNALLYAELANL